MANEGKSKPDTSAGENALGKKGEILSKMPAMKITDYTLLPIGTAIARGEIQACPHCGKNGVKTTVEGITYYTHQERVGLDSTNGLHIGWETCPSDEQVRELLKEKQENLKPAEPK
jgi:hypothetical protein